MQRHSYAYWQGRDLRSQATATWVDGRVARAPDQWHGRLRKTWAAMLDEGGEFQANTWLRETTDAMPTLLLSLSASDMELRQRAEQLADDCLRTAGEFGAAGVVSFYRACVRFCEARGVPPPELETGEVEEIRAAVRRMICPLWWRRRLRVHHGRSIETGAIRLGYVHLRREKYVSDVNVWRRQQQKARNAATLKTQSVVNQFGNEFTLAELAERSNANPHIRRAELMTRIAGFEHIAKGVGDAAEFWTATCPSEYHARLADGGRPNPRHNGSLPRDGQRHLASCFAKFRAWAGRRGVRVYGFRIAEPHHDGCPHWHLLLFMAAELVEKAREGFKKYFLDQHEPDEPGAQKNRVKFVSIDMEKGSAAGYVIKYVSKNIDGYKVQQDLFGGCAVEGAARIESWASTWGIRQFQQIGGAPVGVWRELRRLQPSSQYTDTVERARVAADVGAWADYVALQGGPTIERRNLSLRAAMSREGQVWCPVTQKQVPAMPTRYGEVAPPSVWGVRDMRDGLSFESRRFRWEVINASKAVSGQRSTSARLSGAFEAAQGMGEAEGGSVTKDQDYRNEVGGGFGVPWTRVNNCTVGVSDGVAKRPGRNEGGDAYRRKDVHGARLGVPVEADQQDRSTREEIEQYRRAWE